MQSPLFTLLLRLGLSEKEAVLYEFLLTSGRSKVRDIVAALGIGRVHVYLLLQGLVAKKLVTVIEGKQRLFEAVDPEQLHELARALQQQSLRLSHELDEELPRLRSLYRLGSGKPHVRYFEGIEGLKLAIQDSFLAPNGICTFFDITAFEGVIAEANRAYMQDRISQKIQKRILTADTSEARAFFSELPQKYTEVRFLEKYPQGFSAVTEIYGDTTAFFTLSPQHAIAVLLSDARITAMQQAQFDYLWQLAK